MSDPRHEDLLGEKGFAAIRGVVAANDIQVLQARIADTLNGSGIKTHQNSSTLQIEDDIAGSPEIMLSARTVCETPEFEMLKRNVQEFLSEKVFGADLKDVNWNTIRVNAPDGYKAVNWHQDVQTPYENFEAFYLRDFFTVWVPIANVTKENSLPIRLSPTPTICSVSPWTAGKGRRRRIEEAIRLILDCSENRTGV